MDHDLVEISADVVGRELGEGRFLSLPVGRDTGEDRDRAAGLDPDLGAVERPETANLYVRGEANSQISPMFAGCCLFLAQLVVPRDLQRLAQRLIVFPGIVVLAGEGCVGELI